MNIFFSMPGTLKQYEFANEIQFNFQISFKISFICVKFHSTDKFKGFRGQGGNRAMDRFSSIWMISWIFQMNHSLSLTLLQSPLIDECVRANLSQLREMLVKHTWNGEVIPSSLVSKDILKTPSVDYHWLWRPLLNEFHSNNCNWTCNSVVFFLRANALILPCLLISRNGAPPNARFNLMLLFVSAKREEEVGNQNKTG